MQPNYCLDLDRAPTTKAVGSEYVAKVGTDGFTRRTTELPVGLLPSMLQKLEKAGGGFTRHLGRYIDYLDDASSESAFSGTTITRRLDFFQNFSGSVIWIHSVRSFIFCSS